MTSDTAYFKMLQRMIRAGGKRAGDGDEIELNHFANLEKLIKKELQNAVQQQIKNGHSYNDIAYALGISRQAAHRKFKP